MAHRKRFLGNVMTIGVFTHAAQAVGYLASVVVFRYFIVPEEYGVVAIILVFSGFVAIFSDSGFSYSVIRSRYDEAFLGRLGFLSGFTGLILTFTLALLARPIAWLYDDARLIFPTMGLSLTFMLQSLSIVPKAYLQKQERFRFIGVVTLLTQLVNSGMQITLAMNGFSYWSFIWAPVVAFASQAALYLWRIPFGFNLRGISHIKSTFREVKKLFGFTSGFNLINYWTRKSDDLLIGKFYGVQAVGIYSQAYYLLTFPLQAISNVVRQVMLPAFQAIRDEGSDMNEPYDKLVRTIGLAILPLSAALIIFPEEITFLLRGEDWNAVAEYLPFFGIVGFLQAMLFPISDMFILHHAESKLFKLGIFNSTILISSIFAGALLSVRHVAFFYVLANILFTTPAILYVGFYKTFKMPLRSTLVFWMPRLFISLLILLLVWFEYIQVSRLVAGLAAVGILISERPIIGILVEYFLQKRKKTP